MRVAVVVPGDGVGCHEVRVSDYSRGEVSQA
jgi:hypothetical protein